MSNRIQIRSNLYENVGRCIMLNSYASIYWTLTRVMQNSFFNKIDEKSEWVNKVIIVNNI